MKKLWDGLLFFLFLCFIAVFSILCIFTITSHAQDLFDRAEIEFDIDYIDIDKIKLLGSTRSGFVMAVWMKSGSVLTKTLSKSNKKYETNGSDVYNNSNDNDFHGDGIGDSDGLVRTGYHAYEYFSDVVRGESVGGGVYLWGHAGLFVPLSGLCDREDLVSL